MKGLSQEKIIQGTAGSPGIAFAPVHVEARGTSAPDAYSITEEQVASEQERFNKALEITKKQLNDLHDHIANISGNDTGKIFDTHVMVLEDPMLIKQVRDMIADRLQNAEYAFYAVIQNFIESMRRLNDDYFKERATDLDDVCQRVLKNFQADAPTEKSDHPNYKHILIAYDLSPSDTATMDRSMILGFATEQGSVNSHTAILARSLGIPAIVGLKNILLEAETLSNCILDGYSGKLILNPTEETLKYYKARAARKEKALKKLEELREKKTQTSDGHRITLSANIEFINELPMVKKSGAEGVGLFRSEFLLLENSELPSEDQQTEVYSELASATNPHTAIIRTLDAGGDKLPVEPLSNPEANPFLGWRGIRVSLTRTDIFKDQLRAILRASAHGKLGVMFPMVSGLRETRASKELVKICMDELYQENIPFDENIEIGVMIEVPSAALMTREIAKEVDFFSIGTNDLIQYTVAVDRGNSYVAHLYKTTHPAVIRLINLTILAAKENGIWTGICGEMASDLKLTPLLVGLGIDELSVGSHILPSIKKAIGTLSQSDCAEMVDQALQAPSSADIMNLTLEMAHSHYGDLLD